MVLQTTDYEYVVALRFLFLDPLYLLVIGIGEVGLPGNYFVHFQVVSGLFAIKKNSGREF